MFHHGKTIINEVIEIDAELAAIVPLKSCGMVIRW
jgi:hypothetical protein